MATLDPYGWTLDPTRDEDYGGMFPEPEVSLSLRESQVLRLAAEGLSARESADYLVLGVETVKSYRGMLILKFGAKNMTHAVARALRAGMIA